MRRYSTLGYISWLLFAWLCASSIAAASSKVEQTPAGIEPAKRDLWSRGDARFLREWLVAGPLSVSAAQALDPARLEIEPGKPLSSQADAPRFRPHRAWGDVTTLDELFGDAPDAEPRYAFIAGTITRPHGGIADLSIGAQGALKVWLNGELVHERTDEHAAFFRDSDRFAVRMAEGANRLLIRLEQRANQSGSFAVRVLEPGAYAERAEEITPVLSESANRLRVRTHVHDEPERARVQVQVIGAGGAVRAEHSAARGETLELDTATWPDGAYELRFVTQRPWGERYVTHLPWYRGDALAAARRVIDTARAHADAKADPYAAHLQVLAHLIEDRAQGPLDQVPNLAARVHSALLEFEELQLDRAGRAGSVRPGGFVRLAYVDEIDGSVQFCRVYLPLDYSAEKRWPLVLFLHGYNPANPPYHGWWSVDARHHPAADSREVIYAEPHGRGNAQYLGLGDRDVLRCVDEAQRRLAVDEQRVYLTGESMGGHGTWAIASRHPHVFAAAAPVYGGWDFRVTSIAGPPAPDAQPRNEREFFAQERTSSFSNAESLLNVPLFVLHGDADPAVNVENSRHAAHMLQRWGYRIDYWEMPGWAHEDLKQREHIVDWLLKHRRVEAPREVRVRSTALAGAQAHWLRVDAIEAPMKIIRAHARVVEPGMVYVDSENVAQFTLTLPDELRGKGGALEVVWNGVAANAASNGRELRVGAAGEGLRKRAGVEGPISDIVNTPFAVVLGTISKDAKMREACAMQAEALRTFWQRWQHQPLRFLRDTEVTAEHERNYSLILIGGADANAVTRRLAKRLPMKVTSESIAVADRSWRAQDAVLQMIYPNPSAPQRYVLVVAASSATGMRAWSSQLVHPALGFGIVGYDWMITDARRPPPGAPVDPTNLNIAAGMFDASWRRDDRWTFEGDASERASWRQRALPDPSYAPSADDLAELTGSFELPRFVATVSVEGDRLSVSVPNEPPYALQPKGKDLFCTCDSPLQITVEFVRNDAGQLIGVEVDAPEGMLWGKKL